MFEKGNTIQPAPEQRTRAYTLQRALREAITPDVAVQLFWEAWAAAKKRASPKAMADVLELGLAYAYGKPTQTIEVETASMDLLAVALQSTGPLLPRRESEVTVIDLPRIGQDEEQLPIGFENSASHNLSDTLDAGSSQSAEDALP